MIPSRYVPSLFLFSLDSWWTCSLISSFALCNTERKERRATEKNRESEREERFDSPNDEPFQVGRRRSILSINERATFYSRYSYKVQLHVCNLRFAARAAIRSVTWAAKRSYPRRSSAILVLSFVWKLKWRNGFLMYHVERKKLEDYSELHFLVFLFSEQEWKLKNCAQ